MSIKSCQGEQYLNRKEQNTGIGFRSDLDLARSQVANGQLNPDAAIKFLENEEGTSFPPTLRKEVVCCMAKIANGECLRYVRKLAL